MGIFSEKPETLLFSSGSERMSIVCIGDAFLDLGSDLGSIVGKIDVGHFVIHTVISYHFSFSSFFHFHRSIQRGKPAT